LQIFSRSRIPFGKNPYFSMIPDLYTFANFLL
jgi:hypothetical protein